MGIDQADADLIAEFVCAMCTNFTRRTKFQPKASIMEWTPARVCEFLKTLGLGKLESGILECGIDGTALQQLTPEEWSLSRSFSQRERRGTQETGFRDERDRRIALVRGFGQRAPLHVMRRWSRVKSQRVVPAHKYLVTFLGFF